MRHDKAESEKTMEQGNMMFTGTLIEDLIATVERAEARTKNVEPAEIEPWFASVQKEMNYDSNLLGVA